MQIFAQAESATDTIKTKLNIKTSKTGLALASSSS
jgi:hypothetical protein